MKRVKKGLAPAQMLVFKTERDQEKPYASVGDVGSRYCTFLGRYWIGICSLIISIVALVLNLLK